MIIVGSRCGGFDYYATNKNIAYPLWLGASEKSDLDIFANSLKNINSIFTIEFHDINNFRKPNYYHGYEFPYLENGILHIPKSMDYLSYKIKKKIPFFQRPFFEGQPFDIFDKLGSFVTTIIFKKISNH